MHIVFQPLLVVAHSCENTRKFHVGTIYTTIGDDAYEDHASWSELVHQGTARVTIACVLAVSHCAEMCFIYIEFFLTLFYQSRSYHRVAFLWKVIPFHCMTPSGDIQNAAHFRFMLSHLSEGQANGLHL